MKDLKKENTPAIDAMMSNFEIFWYQHDGTHFYKDEFREFLLTHAKLIRGEAYKSGQEEADWHAERLIEAYDKGREKGLTETIEAGEKIKLNVGHPDWRSAVDCYQSKIKSLSAKLKI